MSKPRPFPIIFLDVDGVLNCQLHYDSPEFLAYRADGRRGPWSRVRYELSQLSRERVAWFSELCRDAGAKVVLSASMRKNKPLAHLQRLFDRAGGDFELIGTTPWGHSVVRGQEIKWWLDAEIPKLFGTFASDYNRFAILDDDSDMLLWQREHFFQCDTYAGLTPNTCYRVRRFLERTNDYRPHARP